MTKEQRDFAASLTNNAQTHEQWLVIVSFGLGELLREPAFFLGLVAREATQQLTREDEPVDNDGLGSWIATILLELGLRIEQTPGD